MIRRTESFNRDWLFSPRDQEAFADPSAPLRGFHRVHLPHANTEVPLNGFSERRTQFVSWYRKPFRVPARPAGSRVFLDFDGVMMAAGVYVNGSPAHHHRGGYGGFSVDATPFLAGGSHNRNMVAVRVDSRLDPGVPPCGRVMDFQPFGGIYRDVRLRLVPESHLDDLAVTTPEPLAPRKAVRARALLRAGAAWEGAAVLELLSPDGRVLGRTVPAPVAAAAGAGTPVEVALEGLEGIRLWDEDDPALYRARLSLFQGKVLHDRVEARIGFREAVFTKEGPFRLNGRPLKLLGLNRHQTYPYIGAAAPERLQKRDADILKRELGCNVVRTSHYPQSPHFLDRCDEIGLLVFEEAPGWGHIGNAGWKDLFCRDVEAMITRDRNHPSVILWGVRVNESADDHDLYARTNALARRLDPSRPTGGVRWGVKSEFLEDVFTANDYSYKPPQAIINEPPVTPYLVTEYGSLADTRRTCPNEVLVKSAVAHAEVTNAILGNPRIAGGIAWCAFDYPSQDGVTIDGIQPWGVMDLFRHPKATAAFYASQQDPAKRVVLQAVTRWKVGDQAGFDPNENTMTSGHGAPLLVFSNCERIEVYIGGEKKGTFEPARDRFPHLPHPPFLCTGLGVLWGPSWKDLRLVGLAGGQVVAEQRFPASHEAPCLAVEADTRELRADGSDLAGVVLRHTDEFGNNQAHSTVVVTLALEGPGTLVGPNPVALAGGVAGVYIRAGTSPGTIRLKAVAPGLGQSHAVVIKVKP